MKQSAATRKRSAARRVVRSGRPPRELAGEVEERILDAAAKVFLERGFEGASIDEIADVARAGKPTIYARFPGKEALFTAVMARNVREITRTFESVVPTGTTIEKRLASIAMGILRKVLVAETVALIRAAVAEARRFPDVAASVSRVGQEGWAEIVAQLLGEVAEPDKLPAFAAHRRVAIARHFIELTMLPIVLRALFGEPLTALRAEIAPHVARTVAFFLAACRQDGIGQTKR
jgi:AcrR family transcriptional regulator